MIENHNLVIGRVWIEYHSLFSIGLIDGNIGFEESQNNVRFVNIGKGVSGVAAYSLPVNNGVKNMIALIRI
jgi:hypothetical protein